MKNLMGNSCAKGCLIYVVALVAIIAATGLGLGGLKGRFDTEPPKGSILGMDRQPLPPSDGRDPEPLPTATLRPLPTIALVPTLPPGSTGPGTTVQFTPVPGQGGAISGEASAPFYVVQSGDTLWEIALRYGVDVDTLRGINNLADNIIQPGQVLYLPQPQQSQPQPAPTLPAILSGGSAQQTPLIPLMPNTGIINR